MHFKQFDCLPNPTQSSLKCYEEIYVLRAVTISKCFTNNITTIIIVLISEPYKLHEICEIALETNIIFSHFKYLHCMKKV